MKLITRYLSIFFIAFSAVFSLTSIAKAEGEKLVFIYHSGDEDFWWNTIKNTLKQAESELGITVDVRNPPTGDSADMARIVEQAAAADYDRHPQLPSKGAQGPRGQHPEDTARYVARHRGDDGRGDAEPRAAPRACGES